MIGQSATIDNPPFPAAASAHLNACKSEAWIHRTSQVGRNLKQSFQHFVRKWFMSFHFLPEPGETTSLLLTGCRLDVKCSPPRHSIQCTRQGLGQKGLQRGREGTSCDPSNCPGRIWQCSADTVLQHGRGLAGVAMPFPPCLQNRALSSLLLPPLPLS